MKNVMISFLSICQVLVANTGLGREACDSLIMDNLAKKIEHVFNEENNIPIKTTGTVELVLTLDKHNERIEIKSDQSANEELFANFLRSDQQKSALLLPIFEAKGTASRYFVTTYFDREYQRIWFTTIGVETKHIAKWGFVNVIEYYAQPGGMTLTDINHKLIKELLEDDHFVSTLKREKVQVSFLVDENGKAKQGKPKAREFAWNSKLLDTLNTWLPGILFPFIRKI